MKAFKNVILCAFINFDFFFNVSKFLFIKSSTFKGDLFLLINMPFMVRYV